MLEFRASATRHGYGRCWCVEPLAFAEPTCTNTLVMAIRTGLPLTNSHNTRSAHLTFRIPHAGACHGLAGYFEAHLYGNIGLSIHPERMHLISPEMMSWFPLFFPFRVSPSRLTCPGISSADHAHLAIFRNRFTCRPVQSWMCISGD